MFLEVLVETGLRNPDLDPFTWCLGGEEAFDFKSRLVVSHCELFLLWLSCLDLIVKCIGEETKYESIRLLFDGLQQPVLNKQVRRLVLVWLPNNRMSGLLPV